MFSISQDFWEIKIMRKQWIPGSLFSSYRKPGYEASLALAGVRPKGNTQCYWQIHA